MEKRGFSLAEIQEIQKESLILLAGPPGAGKSTFCHQAVLNSIATERPVLFVTTEHGPTEVTGLLREKGMRELPPGALSFIDAFGETVGLTTPERPDTIGANCEDLNSISMAIAKMQEKIGRRDIFLAFDSLTSPYLFNEKEVFRFIRLCLAKFASEGNSVLALMDEGCGREEDLGAMMSVADGILRMEIKENIRTIHVVKHPKVKPTRIEVPIEAKPTIKSTLDLEPDMRRQFMKIFFGRGENAVRSEVGDFVNSFWPNLAHWSGMLWDPKGFPTMIYELNKEETTLTKEWSRYWPWHMRFLENLFLSSQALGFFPKNFSRVKDMKKFSKVFGGSPYGSGARMERSGIPEYLEDVSKTDEHYFRVYESSNCWGLENVGAPIASHLPPHIAGQLIAFEKGGRDWNAVETKCIGLGDPYCEFKLVPGEIEELKDSLEKDSSVVERIHERLMERLMGFLLEGKPLMERPRLGSDVHLELVMLAMGFPHLGERYRMAQRMGGARSGKKVGERLMKAGMKEDEAINRVIDFMNYCKVGKVTLDETIRIRENCESIGTKLFTHMKEPCCYFTTGFLNGLFSAVKKQHVRETKCIVAGDPYCEWEII
ncbi:MAG: ATPase domain-containing protein [Chloroflexota bacterium]|nr:ATPase domain-containing protein [Chloroflexota bacterium]